MINVRPNLLVNKNRLNLLKGKKFRLLLKAKTNSMPQIKETTKNY